MQWWAAEEALAAEAVAAARHQRRTLPHPYHNPAGFGFGFQHGYGNPAEEYLRVACDQPQGWVADCTDCNDIAPTANPAADEWCDGEDTNCNGTIDEPDAIDAVTWYFDSDGDEFGDPDIPQIACYQPKDYVDDDLDCDDNDDSINPAADEICNDGVDDDCDLLADDDDGDLDISSAEIWFSDDDGDGYGNPETNVYACETPDGYGDNDQDCDDEDEFVNPDATEICDYINNDCDAATDEAGAWARYRLSLRVAVRRLIARMWEELVASLLRALV